MKRPKYGNVTTRTDDGNGNATIVREGFFKDLPASKTTWFEESKSIDGDKPQLLNETLQAFDLFLNGETDELDIELRRNTYGKIRLVKRHIVK